MGSGLGGGDDHAIVVGGNGHVAVLFADGTYLLCGSSGVAQDGGQRGRELQDLVQRCVAAGELGHAVQDAGDVT